MTVRIVCDHCLGEAELPRISPGRIVHCPHCGQVVAPTISRPFGHAPSPADEHLAWTPVEPDIDDGIPWYVWLGSFAPAAMLAVVVPEPIAFGIAGCLVAVALLVATRSAWSGLARFTGVASLTLAGFAAAVAANLLGQGNFSRMDVSRFLAGDAQGGIPLAEAEWTEFKPPDEYDVEILFPGKVSRFELDEPNGATISVYESKFLKQGATFSLHAFNVVAPRMNEAAETSGLERMHHVSRWIFFEAEPDQGRRLFYFGHPGLESTFTVPVRKTTTVCRSYLVRNRAYLFSVTADSFASIKPYADKFLSSFRIVDPPPAMRTPRTEPPPDWHALGRSPIAAPKPLGSYRGHSQPPIVALAFSKDGTTLISGSSREHLAAWDLATGKGAAIANTEGYPFFAIQPSGKGLVLAMPSALTVPEEIRFIELRESTPELERADTDVVAFAPDGTTTLVALDAQASAWNASDGGLLWRRVAADSPIVCQALSRDGRWLATAGNKDASIRLWDAAKKGSDRASWTAHLIDDKLHAPIQQMAFSPDGATLASAGYDRTVKLWSLADPNRPKLIAVLYHEEPVACVEFSADGKRLATGDFIGIVRVWDAHGGKLRGEFRACENDAPIQMLRFSPDDARLAAAVEMGHSRAGVNVYDVASLPVTADSPSAMIRLTDEPPLFEK